MHKNFLFAFSVILTIFYIAFSFTLQTAFFLGWRILVCFMWTSLVQKLSIPLVILSDFSVLFPNTTASIVEMEGWELAAVLKL